MESNVNSYQLEQNDKNYILTISIIDNALKISCKNTSEPNMIFSRTFTIEGLQKIDEIFNIIKTPLDAIKWIDEALKVQKVGVLDEAPTFKIIFSITTKGITHQIDIPLTKEGENTSIDINEEIKFEKEANIIGETTEIKGTTDLSDSQFTREIGLDPSKVLRHTLHGDKASQIMSSIVEEEKRYLSHINYNINNTTDSYAPQYEENTNINIGTTYDSYPVQDQGYQIMDNNTNIIPTVTNTETNYQYEGTNYDLNQYANTNVQEDVTNYIGNAPEIITDSTAQYTNIENNYNIPDTSSQYNIGEYNVSTTAEVTQYTGDTNQYGNTNDYSNQISLPVETGEIQTVSTYDSKPYIAPADEVYGQTEQFTTTTNNYETYEQGTTGENYEQYFSNATENITQYTAPSYTNAEYNTVETGNIENNGVENTANLEGFGVNIEETNVIDNQTNDLNNFTDNVEQNDLIKSQAEEIKQLKIKIEELTSQKKSEEKDTEEELLKSRIKELEDIKLKQEQEIKDLKQLSAKKTEIKEEKEEEAIEEEKEEEKEEIKEEEKVEAKEEEKEEAKETKEQVKEVKQEIKEEKQEIKEIKKESPEIEKKHIFGERTQKYKVKGDIIHNKDEIELITRKINKINKKITLNLIYKATVDSDKAAAFHEKCDEAKSSLVLVETDQGKRFGGFTTSSWSGNCVDKKDEDAFIFSLDKMKVYSNIPEEDAIGCYPKYGPIFLGCQIRIYDNAFSKGGTTYEKGMNYNTEEDFELTGGEREFKVKEIEVYEVVV